MGSEKLVVLEALTRVAAPPASASEALQGVVKEGGAEAAVAAQLLGRIGAKDAVPTLVKALDDSNSVARRDVLLALGAMGDAQSAEVVAPGPVPRPAGDPRRGGLGAAQDELGRGGGAAGGAQGRLLPEVRVAAGAAPAKEGTGRRGAR